MSEASGETRTRSRTCPRCGTRVSDDATRCAVCGNPLGKATAPETTGDGGSQITLSIPVAIALLAVFALIAAGATYAATRMIGGGQETAATATATEIATETRTPEPTATETPIPTFTPLPTLEYTIVEGDTCLGIALRHDISVQAILSANPGLVCEVLSLGQKVNLPQPTPTASPQPTATLPAAEATLAACETISYTVEANDTLSGIAQNYNVSMQAIMDFTGLTSETVYVGQVLIIPLCERLPTPGPSPTPTPPPPYPAPNLLLPQDGAAFTLADDVVTLQWAAVGELRENEVYRVTVEDITEGTGTVRLVDYVSDTKYIIPSSFRPNESLPHILRWWVQAYRQSGTTEEGEPIFVSTGDKSAPRDFTWSGAVPEATPTP
jgi:LysM repeat protein